MERHTKKSLSTLDDITPAPKIQLKHMDGTVVAHLTSFVYTEELLHNVKNHPELLNHLYQVVVIPDENQNK